MRKILFLFGLMLATFTGTAWAEIASDPIIASTDDNVIACYIKCRDGNYFNSNTSPTSAIENAGEFAFYKVEGVDNAYYIKCLDTDKWLTYDNTATDTDGKGFVTFSDTKENYFNLELSSTYYKIRPYNADGEPNNYLNWHGGTSGYTQTIGLWNSSGGYNVRYQILVKGGAVLTEASQISNTKVYGISSDRGTMTTNTSGTNVVSATNSDAATEGDVLLWSVVNWNSNTYIYNVGTNKYLQSGSTLVNEISNATPVTFEDATSASGEYCIKIKYASGYLNNNNNGGIALDTWSNEDSGNRLRIVAVGDVDLLSMKKALALDRIAGLDILDSYADVVTAINNATTTTEIETALEQLNTSVTFQNRQTSNYLELGETQASFNSSPSNYSNAIKLISAGDGSFYMQGFRSEKYCGDVLKSTQIYTEDSPSTPFLIQKNTDGYRVMRPVKWADSGNPQGYHYIHNNGCVGWESNVDNSQYTMVEIETPAEMCDVVFDFYYNNNLLFTAAESLEKGIAAFVPETLQRDYVDLTVENTTVTTSDQHIRVDATWNGPFELNADYASISKWYDMAVRGTWYVTSDNVAADGALQTVNANAMGLAEDAYQWAFVGSDPWNIKLYNKAIGSDKAYSWTSSSNSSIPAFVDAATANTWWIKKSTSSISNSFMLTTSDYGYQVNQFGGEGGSLKVWAATGTTDAGSAFTVFDVPEDFSEYAVAEILPYLTSTKYFTLTSEAQASIGWQDSYATSCPFSTYKTMKQTLLDILDDDSNLNIPGTGYYRIKSNLYNGYYMTYRQFEDDSNVMHNDVATLNNPGNTIASVVKLTSLGSDTYNLQLEGSYVGTPAQSAKVELVDDAIDFTAVYDLTGNLAFTVGAYYGALHCAASQSYYVVGWTSGATASQWIIEDATEIDITLHAAESNYWATLYAPFGVTLPTGTEAYVGKINEGGNLQLTSIGQDVPAGTAVILCGDAESITATINDAIPAFSGENALQGQYLAADAADDTKLTLGQKDGKVGFYTIDSALGANKAYLTASAGAKGFQIVFSDDDITGIQEFESSEVRESECYYDLTGRKVAAPQKGQLYIVNGKVVKY